jgi:hypothetical protein
LRAAGASNLHSDRTGCPRCLSFRSHRIRPGFAFCCRRVTKTMRLFNSAASRLEAAVSSAKADAPLYVSTYFFRTDFQQKLTDLNGRGSNSLLIPLSPLPPSCLNVLNIALKRPPDDYLLFIGDDLILDFTKHINDLAYIVVTGSGYPPGSKSDIEKAFEPIKATVIDAARHSMDTDCAAINNSSEVKSFTRRLPIWTCCTTGPQP